MSSHKILSMITPIVLLGFLILSCDKAPRTALKDAQEFPKNAPDATVQVPSSTEDIPGETTDMTTLNLQLPHPRFIGTPRTALLGDMDTQPIGFPRPPFYVPVGTVNLSLHRPVTSSDPSPIIGHLNMITDGDKEAQEGSYVELGPSLQHITIDLETPAEVYAIALWHYHQYPAFYYDVIIQVAEDAVFTRRVATIFNNDFDNSAGLGMGTDPSYIETYEGRLINAGGVHGRFIRLYSQGNNCNDLNHYTEVEVYGRPLPTL